MPRSCILDIDKQHMKYVHICKMSILEPLADASAVVFATLCENYTLKLAKMTKLAHLKKCLLMCTIPRTVSCTKRYTESQFIHG